MFYAEVLLNKKVRALDHTFLYEIPPHLIGLVREGSAVRVPFGHANGVGLVIALREDDGGIETKYIDDLINEEFIFPADLMKLASFIADYYLDPRAAVLSAMLPRGVNIFGKLQAEKREAVLVATGLAVPLRSEGQRRIMAYFDDHCELSFRAATEELGFSPSSLRGLIQKGLLEKTYRPVSRYSYRHTASPQAMLPTLTGGQQQVLQTIARRRGEHKPFLLRGVTGSGKTEVYLRLVAEMQAEGKQSIILLPEIALTPQFIAIFENRFPGSVVLMHSRLSEGERRDAWYAAREGRASVILGARSAVFAPCRDLGLIVIDEEHEDSYEQNTQPRFHARTVAVERARLLGATLLLGSATPTLESYQKAQEGEYILLELDTRIGEQPLPSVETVDMRRELQDGWTEMLSRPLLNAIRENLDRGEQTMLYLNRLGFHTFVSCRDCGFVYTCPHCGVTLVYYKGAQALRCHRCNYEQKLEANCPQCGGTRIRYFGTGTEGLESAVRRHFPAARIDRMDSDNTRRKGCFDEIYRRVRSGETDILVGTRMMAKGWDFPGVTLTGIVAADLTLNFPDFRAAEHTFQAITQVAGRCGRGAQPGRVILQTYRPDEPVIQFGGQQDYRGFFAWESARRANYGYPPFAHIVRVCFAAPAARLSAETLARLTELLRAELPEAHRLFGPAPAVYRGGRGEEKWVITLSGVDLSALRAAVKRGFRRMDDEKIIHPEVKCQIEIDSSNII